MELGRLEDRTVATIWKSRLRKRFVEARVHLWHVLRVMAHVCIHAQEALHVRIVCSKSEVAMKNQNVREKRDECAAKRLVQKLCDTFVDCCVILNVFFRKERIRFRTKINCKMCKIT